MFYSYDLTNNLIGAKIMFMGTITAVIYFLKL